MADFGLSRYEDSTEFKYSKVGTPDYVAPEIIE
jgi:serine/threonine protein kinase